MTRTDLKDNGSGSIARIRFYTAVPEKPTKNG